MSSCRIHVLNLAALEVAYSNRLTRHLSQSSVVNKTGLHPLVSVNFVEENNNFGFVF